MLWNNDFVLAGHFRLSKNSGFTPCGAPDGYETLNPYILRLREYAPETAEEKTVFSGAPVTMVRESLAPNDWHILNQVYYYIGADGDFLRNGVTPDGYRTDKSGAYIPED